LTSSSLFSFSRVLFSCFLSGLAFRRSPYGNETFSFLFVLVVQVPLLFVFMLSPPPFFDGWLSLSRPSPFEKYIRSPSRQLFFYVFVLLLCLLLLPFLSDRSALPFLFPSDALNEEVNDVIVFLPWYIVFRRVPFVLSFFDIGLISSMFFNPFTCPETG